MHICFYFLVASVLSKSFITRIEVDGFPIQSFASSEHEYFIQIPYSKKSARIQAFTTDHLKSPCLNHINGTIFMIGSSIPLTGFDTYEISAKPSNKRSDKYRLHFIQVSPISSPIHVSTNKRLTPYDEPESPLINSPRIVGSLPNVEFQHYIATTGKRPIIYTAEGLPSTLTLGKNTGIIRGQAPSTKGNYTVKIVARNSYGADEITLKIVIGDKKLLTPVQGWNSNYVQSQAISQNEMIRMTDALIKNGLNDYNFLYMDIDDGWQGGRNNEKPPKFTGKPDFSNNGVHYGGFYDIPALVTYIHSFGLKAGIYTGPKPMTYAGFIGSSSYNESGMDYDLFSPNNGNTNWNGPEFDDTGAGWGDGGKPGVYQPTQYYGVCWGGYDESYVGKYVGPQWFGDVDTNTFAEWGFDLVKWDWWIGGNPELTEDVVQRLQKAHDNCGRNMLLSLSNNVEHNRDLLQFIKTHDTTLSRMTTDVFDNWGSVSSIAREAMNFIDMQSDGFFVDPDMLLIGHIGSSTGLTNEYRKVYLSETEQYFYFSFWTIYRAPLILSCELSLLEGDNFTLGLLKNREVILMNQDSLGIPAKRLYDGNDDVLVRPLDDGSVGLGFFNYNDDQSHIMIKLEDVQNETGVDLSNGAILRSVWEQKNLGVIYIDFTIKLDGRQGLLYKLIPLEIKE